ncbi:hypothetical protein AB6C52_16255 [Vibrio cyclitrophicus]
MEFELIQGQKIPVTLDSEWIFVEHATGKVQFEIEATGQIFSLTQKSLYKYTGTRFGRIFVSGVGRLVFEHGVGSFTPSMEGQAVTVSTMPAIQLAENQQIKALIEALPLIGLQPDQRIHVDSIPELILAAGQRVAIDSMPVMRMASNQVIGFQASNLLASQKQVMPFSLPRNNDRRNLVLSAPKSNVGVIVVNGGYELEAGEKLELATREAVTFTGDATDHISIIEV